MALVLLIVIDGLVNAFSVDSLNRFLADRNYTVANNNVSAGEAAFRLTVILRLVINSLVIAFFAIYASLTHRRLKAGYIFAVFWSFVMVGNILGAWLIAGSDLPFKILSTVFSVIAIAGLFGHFVELNQYRFYKSRQTRWGGN